MAKSKSQLENSKDLKVKLRILKNNNNNKSKQIPQNKTDMSSSESVISSESIECIDGTCQSSEPTSFENSKASAPRCSKKSSKLLKSSPLRMSVMLNMSRNQPAMTARERVLNWRVEPDLSESRMVPFQDLSSQPSTSSGITVRQVFLFNRFKS